MAYRRRNNIAGELLYPVSFLRYEWSITIPVSFPPFRLSLCKGWINRGTSRPMSTPRNFVRHRRKRPRMVAIVPRDQLFSSTKEHATHFVYPHHNSRDSFAKRLMTFFETVESKEDTWILSKGFNFLLIEINSFN